LIVDWRYTLNIALLKKHISVYKQNLAKDPEKHTKDLVERKERIAYYQSWTKDRIPSMTEDRKRGRIYFSRSFITYSMQTGSVEGL
jgi:hypothetical protein